VVTGEYDLSEINCVKSYHKWYYRVPKCITDIRLNLLFSSKEHLFAVNHYIFIVQDVNINTTTTAIKWNGIVLLFKVIGMNHCGSASDYKNVKSETIKLQILYKTFIDPIGSRALPCNFTHQQAIVVLAVYPG